MNETVKPTKDNTTVVLHDQTAGMATPPGGLRLNLGAGGSTIPGYLSLDIKSGTDIRKLPFPDSSVDAIYCSHALEHIGKIDAIVAMADWARVLKPGGLQIGRAHV